MRKTLDDLDLSELDDFESSDLEEDEEEDASRNDYIGRQWDRYGWNAVSGKARGQDMTPALVTALGMCQSFVDTFASEGRRYRVTFDPSVGTAGTDLIGQRVAITPAPVYDETLTPQKAGIILTAMSTHEVSHDRYGRKTALAVRRLFGNKRAPNVLSNVLDDVRIEKRFAAEYPGYRDVFRPMIEYVATGDQTRPPREPHMGDLVNLMIAAVRFSSFTTWTDETKPERDWWQAWAATWSREDSSRRHVEGVREGLRRIAANQIARPRLNEAAARIKRSLKDLPPLTQRAMRLTAEKKTGDEIATTLGLSLDDAKTLVRAGRKHMAGLD